MNIWSLPPLLVALLFFCIDFLAMIIVRLVFEKRFYLRQWWTYKLGDSIFLPLYGFFTANILQNTLIKPSYVEDIILVGFGILLMLYSEYLHVKYKFYTFKQEHLPSQIYHGIIFVVMFYIVGTSLPVVLVLHPLNWNFVGVLVSIAGYLGTVFIDYSSKKTSKKRKR